MTCDRCHQETTTYKMSWFNLDMICMTCAAEERRHPDYPKARAAEAESLRRGERNFPGIGWPGPAPTTDPGGKADRSQARAVPFADVYGSNASIPVTAITADGVFPARIHPDGTLTLERPDPLPTEGGCDAAATNSE